VNEPVGVWLCVLAVVGAVAGGVVMGVLLWLLGV
jgi:hypothetical protein